MRKLTEAMTNALQSATFDAKRVGTPYSDTDAIHTGWTMYSVNGRTLSAMVKRGLCMGDGGLTEAGMSARVEILDAIAPLDFPQSAQPEECACSGTDNSWCPKHYPAPQFKDAEGNDTYSTPTFPAPAPIGWELWDGTYRGLCSVGTFSDYVRPVWEDRDGCMELCGTCEETLSRCAMLAQERESEPAQDAPMANWEREVMETGTVAPEPAPTLCQDCLTRRATIFDTDAPMCEECYMSSLPASVSTPTPTPVKDAPMASQPRYVHFGNDSASVECGQSQDTPYGSMCTLVLADVTCPDCLSAHAENNPHTAPQPASKPKSGKWDAVLAVKSPTGIYSLPSVDNYPNERAYQSATENADDMCREQGFTLYGPEWLHAFKSSYALSLEIQAEEENNTRYVGVRQGRVGFSAPEHIHVAGCRDIAREMKRWGQKESDTFTYHAGITYADLTFDNWGDIASDNYADPYNEREAWLDMLSWMNDDLSGSKIMPCAQKMELGDTPFGPIVRDGAYYTIEESPIAESPVSEPISQSGVTDCTECGAHIMVNDITVPSQCEDGCPEDTRTPEDMADTMTAPLTIEAQLSVVVDGVTIDLGWHEFTLSAGQTEHDIPAMYGEKNGTWSRPGAPDWASVITVTATGACWH